MANSYLNIVTFLLTTLFYYLALKPSLTYETSKNPENYKQYASKNYLYLAIYFVGIIVVQFFVNTKIVNSKCGGNLTQNMGAAAAITFIAWILIFGVIVLVLLVYPGFKSAFSDVIGYYYISGSANKLLNELLVDKDVQKSIESSNMSPEQKNDMMDAASTIMKICGNTSILINQIVPTNFDDYWNMLTPLMKPQYQNNDTPETNSIRNNLFELVVTRDNVGEAMWYMYTGILIISLVQLKIMSRECESDNQTMKANYDAYLEEQEKLKEQKELSTNQVYTVTG
jgi:hypothetical protein